MDVNVKCRIQEELGKVLDKYDGLSDNTVVLMTMRKDDVKQLQSLLSRITVKSKEIYIANEILGMMSREDGIQMIENDIAMALGHDLVDSGVARFITDNNIETLQFVVRGEVLCVLPPDDNTHI